MPADAPSTYGTQTRGLCLGRPERVVAASQKSVRTRSFELGILRTRSDIAADPTRLPCSGRESLSGMLLSDKQPNDDRRLLPPEHLDDICVPVPGRRGRSR